MAALEKLVARYRSELRRLIAERRDLTSRIRAKREILRDLLETVGEGGSGGGSGSPTPRRGRITQDEAVRTVLADGVPRTAPEIYAAALEAGAGGTERSLRNVLSRRVRDGTLRVDRRTFPQHYRLAENADKAKT
jgi:DNA-binding transcriptional regulator PaaX